MDAGQYERWSAPLRRHPGGARALVFATKALTYFCYVLYPVMLVAQFVLGDPRWIRTLLGPMIGFVLVTVVRRALNAPRPYEELNIDPLIKKNTQGHSHPSRHAYSIFAIAMAVLAWNVPFGIVMLVASVLMCIMRVLGGVHYPRDVAAGAVLGMAVGLITFWVVP